MSLASVMTKHLDCLLGGTEGHREAPLSADDNDVNSLTRILWSQLKDTPYSEGEQLLAGWHSVDDSKRAGNPRFKVEGWNYELTLRNPWRHVGDNRPLVAPHRRRNLTAGGIEGRALAKSKINNN
jgi:hypothetical protein